MINILIFAFRLIWRREENEVKDTEAHTLDYSKGFKKAFRKIKNLTKNIRESG